MYEILRGRLVGRYCPEHQAIAAGLLERIEMAEHCSDAATASLRDQLTEPLEVDAFDQAIADFIAGEQLAQRVVDVAVDQLGDGRELERCLEMVCAATPAWRSGFARALQKALEASAR